VLLNEELAEHIKEMGLDVIRTISEFRRSILSKNPALLQQVMDALFQLVHMFKQSEQHEDEDQNFQYSVLDLVETLTQNLPKNKIYKQFLSGILKMTQSSDQTQVYAGFTILSRTVQGFSEKMRNDLPDFMRLIDLGLKNANPKCRRVTIYTIASMTEFINPEIFEYHAILLPALLNQLSDSNCDVVEQSMSAIDLFCESLSAKLEQYLPSLIP